MGLTVEENGNEEIDGVHETISHFMSLRGEASHSRSIAGGSSTSERLPPRSYGATGEVGRQETAAPARMPPSSSSSSSWAVRTVAVESAAADLGPPPVSACFTIVRPAVRLPSSTWNPRRPAGAQYWDAPAADQRNRMPVEDAEEIVEALLAGALLTMPADAELRHFWCRLVGSCSANYNDHEEERRHQSWAVRRWLCWKLLFFSFVFSAIKGICPWTRADESR